MHASEGACESTIARSRRGGRMTLDHRTSKTIERGENFPLGAAVVDGGVNFALYSKHASDVFLLLFDTPDGEPTDVIRLDYCEKFIWHAQVNGVGAGQL